MLLGRFCLIIEKDII